METNESQESNNSEVPEEASETDGDQVIEPDAAPAIDPEPVIRVPSGRLTLSAEETPAGQAEPDGLPTPADESESATQEAPAGEGGVGSATPEGEGEAAPRTRAGQDAHTASTTEATPAAQAAPTTQTTPFIQTPTVAHPVQQRAQAQGQQGQRPNNANVIDLYELFVAIRRRFWSVLLTGLVAASVAAMITAFILPTSYTSSSLMLVLTKETTLESLADFQIGTSLTNDYTVLIQSRPVLQEVVDNLDLNETYQQLRSHLTVSNQDDTRILQLDVSDEDPQMAKRIVDEVASVSSAYIADQMEITAPKIIEEGELPTQKTSPSMSRNVVIGFLIGLLAASAVIVVGQISNDAITTEDDVERYLGLITYANVPEREDTGTKSKKSKRVIRIKRKHRELKVQGEE